MVVLARLVQQALLTQTEEDQMYPGISVCVLSRDPDLVTDTVSMYKRCDAEVFVASSFAEYERLQADGVVFEVLVVDPVFRLAD